MNKLIGVDSIDVECLPAYNLVLATLGYESRAVHASVRLSPQSDHRIACGFLDRHVAAFDDNQRWFRDSGFDIQLIPEIEIEAWTASCVKKIVDRANKAEEIRFWVDISSMSRLRLASFLAAILKIESVQRICVDFVYSIAKWVAPSEEPEPIAIAGAVLPFFAGWSKKPDLPTVALIGLGYEPDKAVGSYEFLEAAGVWVFLPISEDERYTRDVDRANRSLLKRLMPNQQISYRVDQPLTCFGLIESVIYGTLENARPVLLPFGPKIFALCSMLVACLHREVPVWRITSAQHGEPTDRKPSSKIIGMRAVFQTAASSTKTVR